MRFYTIKELADEFQVTKAGVLRRLTDDFRKKYVKTVAGKTGNQLEVNEDGYKVLRKHFSRNNSRNDSQQQQSANITNMELVEVLKEQLKEKDQQIERLQLLLNQSQQLQLSSAEKVKKLENKLDKATNKNNEVQERNHKDEQKQSSVKDEENVTKKKGFWQRFFG